MIVVGGCGGGLLGSSLQRGAAVTRIFALAGASACVSGFFMNPLAGAIFVLSMPHRSGELQFYEATKASIVASVGCVATLQALLGAEEHQWTFPPGAHHTTAVHALGAGVLFGPVGAALSTLFYLVDKACVWLVATLRLPRPVYMTLGALAFGSVAMALPQTLFWSEEQVREGMEPLQGWRESSCKHATLRACRTNPQGALHKRGPPQGGALPPRGGLPCLRGTDPEASLTVTRPSMARSLTSWVSQRAPPSHSSLPASCCTLAPPPLPTPRRPCSQPDWRRRLSPHSPRRLGTQGASSIR